MRNLERTVDFCVVGGGMAGLCAAIAAARRGVKTALIQDRPVLGGNASSEIRMWICGAHSDNNHETGRVDPEGGDNNHETGIIEEILLENLWRNRWPNYSVWDSILYEKARFQENLSLFLNTYVDRVEVAHEQVSGPGASATKDVTVVEIGEAAGSGTGPVPGAVRSGAGGDSGSTRSLHPRRILSVSGLQMTTETRLTVRAANFADCSGDGILGALAGAEYRMGREARSEFNESIAPEVADKRTMGLSCLIQARETDRPQPFIAPEWAYRYDNDGLLPNREHRITGTQNFWWLEVGGMQDTVHDKEELRDELLKIAFGIWDHIKNRGDHGADNWALDWVGFLPGKRESRRFVGDHILCQSDVEAAGKHFNDIVAYGGWTMDDHFPEGFYKKEAGTIFHAAPSPYGIPYRSLYSRNVENLFFAGRNISATHSALSSTRVMATCATLGQAIGTAAAIATREGLSPRAVHGERIRELQEMLMEDDCYLPFTRRTVNALTSEARLSATAGDPELLRNGFDRQIGLERNSWDARPGDSISFTWDREVEIDSIRLVLDPDLNRTTHNMVSYYTMASQDFAVPPQLLKSFRIEALSSPEQDERAAQGPETGGSWKSVALVTDNHQRLLRLHLGIKARAVRLVAGGTWGAEEVRIFAVDLYPGSGKKGSRA